MAILMCLFNFRNKLFYTNQKENRTKVSVVCTLEALEMCPSAVLVRITVKHGLKNLRLQTRCSLCC